KAGKHAGVFEFAVKERLPGADLPGGIKIAHTVRREQTGAVVLVWKVDFLDLLVGWNAGKLISRNELVSCILQRLHEMVVHIIGDPQAGGLTLPVTPAPTAAPWARPEHARCFRTACLSAAARASAN